MYPICNSELRANSSLLLRSCSQLDGHFAHSLSHGIGCIHRKLADRSTFNQVLHPNVPRGTREVQSHSRLYPRFPGAHRTIHRSASEYAKRGINVFAFDQREFGRTALDEENRSPESEYGRTHGAAQMDDVQWALRHAIDTFPKGTRRLYLTLSQFGRMAARSRVIRYSTKCAQKTRSQYVAHLVATCPIWFIGEKNCSIQLTGCLSHAYILTHCYGPSLVNLTSPPKPSTTSSTATTSTLLFIRMRSTSSLMSPNVERRF
ncbi:hypothetical protein C8R45DRAFT_1081064 [Mycena sanguinolenta]|nr:hypothetical protein C8R45DRAFT_1081064 [Mycena sanguinolenta]